MKKDNKLLAVNGEPTAHMTRARAAAYLTHSMLPPKPSSSGLETKRITRANSKRPALHANCHSNLAKESHGQKRRAVLGDITNCISSYKNCISAEKIQIMDKKNAKFVASKRESKISPVVFSGVSDVTNSKNKISDETCRTGVSESQETFFLTERKETVEAKQCLSSITNDKSLIASSCKMKLLVEQQSFMKASETINISKKEEVNACLNGNGNSHQLKHMDIDLDKRNPQLCCIYASDIYMNLRVAELHHRPCSDYMEKIQRDITQSMRGILIDWLVEVSEEYKLVPDTLYLTVYYIDRFLSQNYIERTKLQLLGVTCMLIASKYEEICAPHVEEFCSITDNTYTKEEVLKMEILVLNHLGFQLSAPTIKSFLRRFLRAAQVSYKVPVVALEFISNYLAELTLINYEFLKFPPSMIAASAVFLARWTLDQSYHPWNSTLEHYTSYKALDLKQAVLSMRETQINSKNCPLNAIGDKYMQPKFYSVASLSSPELLEKLFR